MKNECTEMPSGFGLIAMLVSIKSNGIGSF